MKQSTLSLKLTKQLIARNVTLPEGESQYQIQRTHAGRCQKSAGAWTWFLTTLENKPLNIGSSYPASEILKATYISITYNKNTQSWCVEPETKPENDGLFDHYRYKITKAEPK